MFKKQSLRSKQLISVSLALLFVLGMVGTVSAAEFPKNETIPEGETIDDDVFISGDNVVVDGTVNGILVAAGQTVTLNGRVNGDAFLFGETVIVDEAAVVDGNVFIGAGDVTINGSVTGSVFGGSADMLVQSGTDVGRNFFFGGFSLALEEGAVVGKDLYTGNYQSLMSGYVGRDFVVGAGAVELNGEVGRNAIIEVGDEEAQRGSMDWMRFNPSLSQYVTEVVQPGIRVSENASIGGTLKYISSVNQTAALENVTSGIVVYQTPAPGESKTGVEFNRDEVQPFSRTFPNFAVRASVLSAARNFIKLMALGALILWLLRKPFIKIVEAAYGNPLKALGWGFIVAAAGFLAVFVVPFVFIMVGVIIGFLSVGSLLYFWFGLVGLAATLAFGLFFFALFTLSKIVASYMFGRWIMKVVFKEEKEKVWLNLLVGVFLFIIIRAIPFVGWLAGLTAVLIGSGAFWLALRGSKK